MSGSGPQFLDVSRIFEPGSVAVVGASDRPGNLGGDTVRRLLKFKFPGPVWPVNRSAEPVAGVPGFAELRDLPGAPDLVVFAIPASGLLEAVGEAVAVGARAGIAYAGGLAEAGGEGVDLQRALADFCCANGFMLCGPNCVGTINASLPVTATFATALYEMDRLRSGAISMVSQSGGIGTTALSLAEQAGFGFRHLISSGNEAVLGFADYLYALARDDGTEVIAGYLEGITDGAKFVAALEEARARGKPVVLIKAGATSASARAAQAHTGALVGEDRVFDAVLQELGVIRVYSVEELIDVALMLVGAGRAKIPQGRGVGVVTFGGGNGVLAADQCAQSGLTTPPLSPECVRRLRPLLVSVASAANPMDLTPSTAFRAESLARLPEALDVIAGEPEIHSLIFIVGSLASKAAEISDVIRAFWARSLKPVCVSWPSPPKGVPERLAEHGIYTYLDYARGVRALGRIAAHGEAMRRPAGGRRKALPVFDWSAHVGRDGDHLVVPEHRCHQILEAAGLAVAAGELVHDAGAAVAAAERMGLPVVLKGISPAVTHRAAAGLLAVGLQSREAVEEAYGRLVGRAQEIAVELDGIYVQKMQRGGAELLVSAFRDPVFGTMISCGAGGGLTELINDVVTQRAPVDAATAAGMIERLRLRAYARDAMGLLPTDAAADFVARFSELAATAPWERFVFEVNPIKWRRDAAVAVDGLLIVG